MVKRWEREGIGTETFAIESIALVPLECRFLVLFLGLWCGSVCCRVGVGVAVDERSIIHCARMVTVMGNRDL